MKPLKGLKDGDVVEVFIGGIGTIRNQMVFQCDTQTRKSDPCRTWSIYHRHCQETLGKSTIKLFPKL